MERYGFDNFWELYNIKNDPTETNDLSNNKTKLVGELETKFYDWGKRVSVK